MVITTILVSLFLIVGCGDDDDPDPPVNLAGKVIILQAYGSGDGPDGAGISHSFVELYNITNESLSLSGVSLYYADGTTVPSGTNTATEDPEWKRIALSGSIPAKGSYLILGPKKNTNPRYTIPDNSGDINNVNFVLSNRAFKVALIRGNNDLTVQNPFTANNSKPVSGYIDMVGAANTYGTRDMIFGYEEAPARNSASAAVRRKDLIDTDDNSEDFVSLDYRLWSAGEPTRMKAEELEVRKPRNSSAGTWDPFADPADPVLGVAITGKGVSSGKLNLAHEAVIILTANVTPAYAEVTDETYLWSVTDQTPAGVLTFDVANEKTFEITAAQIGTATVNITVSGDSLTTPLQTSILVTVSEGTPMLMILQANTYGNDNGGGGGFARSIVELYNNTGDEIDFDTDDYFLHIRNSTSWITVIKLEGKVPAKSSFLVVDNTETASNNTNATPRANLPTADQYAPFVFANNAVIVALMRTGEDLGSANPFTNPDFEADYVDMLGSGSSNSQNIFETSNADQSRPQSPRRTSLTDTDNNGTDFEQIDFRGTGAGNGMLDSELYKYWPRNSTMGTWNPITGTPQIDPAVATP
jgi:hypothetical protein